jgi:hypothetical protein
MAQPDLPPFGGPPSDLLERELLLAEWGAPVYRVHHRERDPIFFGKTGRHRFDDPQNQYGVLYASADLDGAFSETFAGVSSLSVSSLTVNGWSVIESRRALRLCDLREHGLARIGADGRLCTGSRRDAQAWSRQLWRHPATIDGICYPARTDLSKTSVAIFDRAKDDITASSRGTFLDPQNRQAAAQLLDRYGIALIPG